MVTGTLFHLVAAVSSLAAQEPVRELIERYSADRDDLRRYYAIEVSPTRAARFERFNAEKLAELGAVDFDKLDNAGRADYLLLRNHLQHEQRKLALAHARTADARALVPFSKIVVDLEESRRRMEPIDSAEAARSLDSLARQAHAALAEAAKTKASAVAANRAATIVADLRNALRDWFNFYNGYHPLFTWWCGEPYKTADAALDSYAKHLSEQPGGAKDRRTIVGEPIGREGLMSELAHEMISYTPEELIEIANKEFAWCDQEMLRASRDLGFGDDWKKALEHVKGLYVEPGKQPDLVRDLAREAIDYVEKHDLVTVPPLDKETLLMSMMSPERQLQNPFFLGGSRIVVSYPTNTMTFEQRMMSMRGNNAHFSRATVFHELIPGHNLQMFVAERSRPYRRLFQTPFFVEGWALYWEFLLWDRGFPRSPEDRIGMLFWRMHRCARIIFSLSFHLGKMTPQQSIDFLVDRVGFERDNAEAEVRRSFAGNYSPLYQAAYMLGALQIRALRREMEGRMPLKQFNDALLRQNAIPVAVIRALFSGRPLAKDFSYQWRFY
jgi:uncharacterized protein (DUF885 family)